MNKEQSNLIIRAGHFLERFASDIASLFRSDNLYVYSWMSYRGAKMLNNNWGDDINKYFIESISSFRVKDIASSWLYRIVPVKAYTCIGSILGNFHARYYEVWGSGIVEKGKLLLSVPKKVHSVRGLLTRQELLAKGIECPEIYGDPALLVSRYYRPSFEKKYRLGIIPHYMDVDNPALKLFCRKHPDVHIINMQGYRDWRDIPQEICCCSKIISSSLHGLIIADSYRVPNAWVRFSDNVKGGDFKYLDYFSSVGRMETAPYYVKSEADIKKIMINNMFSIAPYDKINYRGIFEACPFKERLIDYMDVAPKLPEYKSFDEKEGLFCANEYINSEDELDRMIIHLHSKENDYIFRGVSEACYKMFASSQRHWMQKSDWVARMGHDDYYSFVEEIIRRTECSDEVQQYIQLNNVHTNDMFLMALLQHFDAPSPMIDFSENLLTGLFFASDWDDSKWFDSGNQEISDYISLYYISKGGDWVEASVQRIMQSAAESIERMVSEAIADGISIDTKETEDNISRLLYRQFRLDRDQSDITFIPIGGPSLGKVSINIPVINFHCEYSIINDRIVKQQGMFIMNNTVDKPLEIVMNQLARKKMFYCVNIHKKLIPYLRKKYLRPNSLEHDIVYEYGKQEVRNLVKAIKCLS